MKPIFSKVVETVGEEIFAVRITERKTFSTEFHFHKECQMTYIVRSKGKRLIGDSIANFDDDELTFLGADLAHVWYSDEVADENIDKANAYSIALFFDQERLLQHLSCFFDTSKLELLLEKSRRGFIFHGDTKEKVKEILHKMVEADNLHRTIGLIQLIDILVHTDEFTYLSGENYSNKYIPTDMKRIEKVFQYVFENYSSEISLQEVASLMNLSRYAFCRYFKVRTQKTFVQFVNEIRIMHACEMIKEDKEQIGNIAYCCGFNSLSNFNKIFKTIKGRTPSQYKSELNNSMRLSTVSVN